MAKARAVLIEDSVRFGMPLASPAAVGEQAVGWLNSPIDAVSRDTILILQPGDRIASLTLPLIKEEHLHESRETGWFRNGYWIEANGASAAKGVGGFE